MNFLQKDFDQIPLLEGITKKIDCIDAEYVNLVSDEIFQKQPFFLAVLIGYRFDVSVEELEEIMKIYFLIWEYFKDREGVQTKKVTEEYFEKMQKRNIDMLKYSEGEPTQSDQMKIHSADLQNLQSKVLFGTIGLRFNTRPVLSKMGTEKRGIILIGIKSFIECFETI